MVYLDGPDIMEYTQPLRMSGNQTMLIYSAKIILMSMLLALKYIHSRGIIHNDVKPENIVVSERRVPVLVDLGISCYTLPSRHPTCTRPYRKIVDQCCNETCGTILYIPPEAFRGVRYPSSDLWSLGVTIYAIMK